MQAHEHACWTLHEAESCCRFLSTNDEDSEWQPHPCTPAKETADDSRRHRAAEDQPKQQPRQWWRRFLRGAGKGRSEEAASLLPKQTQPLSFDTAAFRRQHVTGAASCVAEGWLKCSSIAVHIDEGSFCQYPAAVSALYAQQVSCIADEKFSFSFNLSEVRPYAPEVSFAPVGSEMPSGPSICAVLLQDASFAWGARNGADGEHADEAKRAAEARHQPSSSTVRGWALAQSSAVLRELTLAIPQSSLTAIVGDIGSGEHPYSKQEAALCTLSRE